jgi:hypothetical protein
MKRFQPGNQKKKEGVELRPSAARVSDADLSDSDEGCVMISLHSIYPEVPPPASAHRSSIQAAAPPMSAQRPVIQEDRAAASVRSRRSSINYSEATVHTIYFLILLDTFPDETARSFLLSNLFMFIESFNSQKTNYQEKKVKIETLTATRIAIPKIIFSESCDYGLVVGFDSALPECLSTAKTNLQLPGCINKPRVTILLNYKSVPFQDAGIPRAEIQKFIEDTDSLYYETHSQFELDISPIWTNLALNIIKTCYLKFDLKELLAQLIGMQKERERVCEFLKRDIDELSKKHLGVYNDLEVSSFDIDQERLTKYTKDKIILANYVRCIKWALTSFDDNLDFFLKDCPKPSFENSTEIIPLAQKFFQLMKQILPNVRNSPSPPVKVGSAPNSLEYYDSSAAASSSSSFSQPCLPPIVREHRNVSAAAAAPPPSSVLMPLPLSGRELPAAGEAMFQRYERIRSAMNAEIQRGLNTVVGLQGYVEQFIDLLNHIRGNLYIAFNNRSLVALLEYYDQLKQDEDLNSLKRELSCPKPEWTTLFSQL